MSNKNSSKLSHQDDEALNQALMSRFDQAGTMQGRLRLRGAVLWKRWSWKWVVGGTLLIKRIFDFFAALILIIVFTPLFLLLSALVKLEDGGPVFFYQPRVGKDGKMFNMIKYRSMCVDAEARLEALKAKNQHEDGVTFKMKDDPRITKIGKWLRKLSLDELPQLFNVLKGEMSLVGPRPPVPREVELYSQSERRRLSIMPGITCLWQIGGRSEIDFSGQVRLDVQYIESRSFWGDLWILLKTIPAVLLGKGAY